MTTAVLVPASRLRIRPNLAVGGIITGSMVAVALLSQVWTPENPTRMRIASRLRPPLASGLAGTDALGHDIFSMLMAGAWNSLSIAVGAVLLGLVAGVALGTAAAAMRGTG